MAIALASVIPVGEGISVSSFVADSIKAIKNFKDIKFQITGMGTIIEGEIEKVFEALKLMHLAQINSGAKRVYTVITIDDRRDKITSAELKVESLKERLKG
ncbi:MAG: MTH1187 family thiamine-binding protein [Candidatus Aminicenantia bacterium]